MLALAKGGFSCGPRRFFRRTESKRWRLCGAAYLDVDSIRNEEAWTCIDEDAEEDTCGRILAGPEDLGANPAIRTVRNDIFPMMLPPGIYPERINGGLKRMLLKNFLIRLD